MIRAYEDGTNFSSHTYINGGDIIVTTATGDAIDSNGNIYIAGGKMTDIGATSPEQGLDAGDGYKVYITGGQILAAGGGNSAPSGGDSTQAYVLLNQSFTAGDTVTVNDGTTDLVSFVIPEAYGNNNSTRGPGGWDWGWGGPGGGQGGNSILISCPEMVSGCSYTVNVGSSSTTAIARISGGGSGF